MTSIQSYVNYGALAPMVSKDKGNISNRLECTGAQMKNNLSTAVKTSGVSAAAVGTTYL